MDKSTIVQATLSDMRYLIDCARSEGWNPGLDDAIPYYFTDPRGFFIERIGKQTIGCISAVAYDEFYGFMGFYIVTPEFRHQGYGLKLWNHAMAYLGDRAIGLDGVVAQQNNYRKSGFTFYYNNMRYGGKAKGRPNQDLQTLDTISFQTLMDYDSKTIGFNRSIFLQHWITRPHCFGLANIEGSKLSGYGVIRKCGQGYKIGPLFADSRLIADRIYLALADFCKNSDIFLDVVQTNTEAMNFALDHGLNQIFETARMYKGAPPKQRIDNIFGVTSFELG